MKTRIDEILEEFEKGSTFESIEPTKTIGGAKHMVPIFSSVWDVTAMKQHLSTFVAALANRDVVVEIAKEELKHIHELIHVAEKRIELGKAYLRGTIDEYNRGVKNAPDVLNSMQRYVSYQRRYIDLRRDYQVSKAGLQAVLEE